MRGWIPNALTLAGAFAALLFVLWAPNHAYWACNALIAAALFNSAAQTAGKFSGIPTPVAALLVCTSIMSCHEIGVALFAQLWFLIALLCSVAALATRLRTALRAR